MIRTVEEMILSDKRRVSYVIPNREAGILNQLYRVATVESVTYSDDAITAVAWADAKARGMMKEYAVVDGEAEKESWE